jgi:chemotaxis methyl-accepting protein methylase
VTRPTLPDGPRSPLAAHQASASGIDYEGYEARAGIRRGPWYRALRAVYRFLKNRVLIGTLLYPYGVLRHRMLLRSADRSQHHTYTAFFRSPIQLEALTGPVIEFLMGQPPARRRLEILQFACSNGAEAYSMASMLMRVRPELDFRIQASDLHEEMVAHAIAARYSRDEVLHHEYITDAFLAATFDQVPDGFVVKPEIRARVSFGQVSLLDPELPRRFQPADMVVAQNVLFHLDRAAASTAFQYLVSLLRPRAVLVIAGMDLDLKEALTREARLAPLSYRCREIHEQGRSHIPLAWWRYYYGAEPYSVLRRDRYRRYGTVFTRSLPDPSR